MPGIKFTGCRTKREADTKRYVDSHPSSMSALWRALDLQKTGEVQAVTVNRLAENVVAAINLHGVVGHCSCGPRESVVDVGMLGREYIPYDNDVSDVDIDIDQATHI